MENSIYIDGKYFDREFVLKEKHRGIGLYREKTPSGYNVRRSWIVADGSVILVVYPYMNMYYEDMIKLIDDYIDYGKLNKCVIIQEERAL